MINQNQPEGKTGARPDATGGPVALLYCTDLMFAVQLQNMARKTGYRSANARPGFPLTDADVMVVDLASKGDWEAAIREVSRRGVPVIAFGPHMDSEGRKRAKAAGAARVLANSNLARDLPRILMDLRERGVADQVEDEDNEREA